MGMVPGVGQVPLAPPALAVDAYTQSARLTPGPLDLLPSPTPGGGL